MCVYSVSNHLPLQIFFLIKFETPQLIPFVLFLLFFTWCQFTIHSQWGFLDDDDRNSNDLKCAKSIWNSRKYFHFPKYFFTSVSNSEETSTKWISIVREEFCLNLCYSTTSSQYGEAPLQATEIFICVTIGKLFLVLFWIL